MSIEHQGSPRILRSTSGYLEVTLYNDGTAADATGTPTVTVTRADGSAIATDAVTTKPAGTTGVYRYTLTPAQLADVDNLTAVWTFEMGGVAGQKVTTYVRIVGDVVFTEAEARAFDGGALSNVSTYPDRDILLARDRIQDAFEDIVEIPLGLALERRYVDGDGHAHIWVAGEEVARVRAAATRSSGAATFTALTASELADVIVVGSRIHRLSGSWPSGIGNVRIDYEHGLQPIPSELKRAALVLLRNQIVGSNLTDRTTSYSDETGTFALATPGLRGSYFGLPAVDEVLHRYRRKVPVAV